MSTTDHDITRHYTHGSLEQSILAGLGAGGQRSEGEAMKARVARLGVPPLGLHIMMRRDAPVKVDNMIENLARGAIARWR